MPAGNRISENRLLPRDLVHQLLDQKVDHYMKISFNCAQSSFLALEEQFGLEGDDILKALTPLAGIAERGETCGAVTGPLMAIGLVYGRDKNQLGNWEKYRESLLPAGRFCSQFEQEFGSTMCRDIQKAKFGRSYNLTVPEELSMFQEADATKQCSAIVRVAVRLAADQILDLE
jgi:C_GCAxxG_C_C family probable redox protein